MSGSEELKSIEHYMTPEGEIEFAQLTEEQQAEVFRNADVLPVEGDTAAMAEPGETPAAGTEGDAQTGAATEGAADPAKAGDAATDGAKPAEQQPVVQAKDGIHTIPYSELEAAREKARSLELVVEQQKQLLADLEAAKAADAATGGTAAQEAVIAEYQGEFPEVAADMKPYIQAMIQAGIKEGVEAQLAAVKAELAQVVQPMKDQAAKTAEDEHFGQIRKVHNDFETLIQGDTLEKWIETKPSFMQPVLREVLDRGTTAQVIELFDAYKADNKPAATEQPQNAADAKKAADEAIAAAKAPVPRSLSDFPGAGAQHVDEASALLSAGPGELDRRFSGKTPEQILETLSRVV